MILEKVMRLRVDTVGLVFFGLVSVQPSVSYTQTTAQEMLSRASPTLSLSCQITGNRGTAQISLEVFKEDYVMYRQDGDSMKMERGTGFGTFDSSGSRYVVDISDPTGFPVFVMFDADQMSVELNAMNGAIVQTGRCW